MSSFVGSRWKIWQQQWLVEETCPEGVLIASLSPSSLRSLLFSFLFYRTSQPNKWAASEHRHGKRLSNTLRFSSLAHSLPPSLFRSPNKNNNNMRKGEGRKRRSLPKRKWVKSEVKCVWLYGTASSNNNKKKTQKEKSGTSSQQNIKRGLLAHLKQKTVFFFFNVPVRLLFFFEVTTTSISFFLCLWNTHLILFGLTAFFANSFAESPFPWSTPASLLEGQQWIARRRLRRWKVENRKVQRKDLNETSVLFEGHFFL